MWKFLLLAGITWIIATIWTGIILLGWADNVADEGLISDPKQLQKTVAIISIGIFGLPGLALIIAGWQRRK
ncbi:MAG: hypothetical protein CL763_03825 [Chloroflexi bacterium]|mgnify:CR=1 FL=1|nr:hypothetical protein [Chloroflexota bacterium]|tara:strand:- start:6100 stop:6312 length:213 start_codon:yes stop_codon:yes gene_type:complete